MNDNVRLRCFLADYGPRGIGVVHIQGKTWMDAMDSWFEQFGDLDGPRPVRMIEVDCDEWKGGGE